MPRPISLTLFAAWMAACSSLPSAAPPPPPPAPTPQGTLMEGVVRNASGEPVAEAVVALVSASMTWNALKEPPAARVRTSPEGRFRIEGLPPGGYTLNITATGLDATYRTGLRLEAGQPLTHQEWRLESKGVVVQGVARKRDGTPVPEAWVGLARVSNDSGDIAYTQADAKGAWSVQAIPGSYMLYTEAPGHAGGPFAVQVTGIAPPPQDVYVDPRPMEVPPSGEVVALLRKAAVPLATVEAGHGFEDLRPMAPWLSGARVVALGEATHGTREFFQLKHRMLEWLATEHGFTLFGIEANFAEALVVNDYVLTGKGDPGAALAGMHVWPWDTEEVLALIQWMRAYNADPKHPKKLKFYGFDMQFTGGSVRALLEYLRKVDPGLARKVEAPLAPLMAKDVLANLQQGTTPEAMATFQGALAEIQKALGAQRAAYVRKSSEWDLAFAVRHAELLTYLVGTFDPSQGHVSLSRDRIMAENVQWLLKQEGPGAKMVAWAHNLHVSTPTHSFPSMGRYLREALGGAFYTFGFVFNQGSFQAIELPPPGRPGRGLIVYSLAPARPGMLDSSLALVGLPLFALDMRGPPRDSALGAFFRETRWSRQIGAAYGEITADDAITPAEEFDGVLFVEKTSAATATPTGRR